MFTGRVAPIILPAILAVLILSTWISMPAQAAEEPKAPGVGDKAVDFSLPFYGSGAEFKLSNSLGKEIIVLAFMQTSCVSCRNELISLRKVVQERPDAPFAVYPISVDYDAADRLKSYKKFYRFDFPFLMDPEFTIAPLYGYTYTPALVVIGLGGRIAMKLSGFHEGDGEKILNKLDSLLSKVAEKE